MKAQSQHAHQIWKAACAFGMVAVHAVVWLVSVNDTFLDPQHFLSRFIPSLTVFGFFSLCVPATAGAAFHFALSQRRLESEAKIWNFVIAVVATLTGLGFLMNFFTWGALSTFHWDALQFIALSFVVLATVHLAFRQRRGAETVALALVGLTVACLAPGLRETFGETDQYAVKIFLGDRWGSSFWPFFPWFSVVALGYLLAGFEVRPRLLLPLGAGLGLLALAVGQSTVSLHAQHIWGPDVFLPSPGILLGTGGFYCLGLGLARILVPWIKPNGYGLFPSFANGVLWIYLGHTIIGYHSSFWVRRTLPPAISLWLFPLALLALSWAIGALAVWVRSRRLIIRVRRLGTSS